MIQRPKSKAVFSPRRGLVWTGITLSAIALTIAGLSVFAADSGPTLPLPNYREWVFLSSGLGMTYGPLAAEATNDKPLFDNVFVSPPAYQAFLKSGQWPDKTTFVLEVRSSESRGSINKGGHYQAGITGVEAEVKDHGQWTFYSFGSSGTQGKPFPRSERCYACHSANGAVDNTFVQFYPTLLPAAKEHGTLKSPVAFLEHRH